MRRLCIFLGIPYDQMLLEPTLFGEKSIVGTSSRPTAEVFSQEADWRKGMAPHHLDVASLLCDESLVLFQGGQMEVARLSSAQM